MMLVSYLVLYSCFQSSVNGVLILLLRYSALIGSYGRSRPAYRSKLKLEHGTNKLFRNVGSYELTLHYVPEGPIRWRYPETDSKAQKGVRGITLHSLDLGARRGWVVSTTPRPLYPRERPGNHCTGGWMGPRAGLDLCKKSRPYRYFFFRSLDRPARSQSLYRLGYPGPRMANTSI
jgi:hypothetical protein